MKKNRKWCTAMLAAMLCLGTIGIAAEPTIDIKSISIEEGLVLVETENRAEIDTTFTLTVSKDSGISGADKYYAVYMENVKAGESRIFQFKIPDEKKGVSGSGSYTVKLVNYEDEGVSKQFSYATNGDVNAFLDLLKAEAAKITEGTEPYTIILPVVINHPQRAEIFFSIGLDDAAFAENDEAVQQQTMNFLYEIGIDELTAETFPEALSSAFAVAVYNSGSKEEGLSEYALNYDGKEIDADLIPATVTAMQTSYESIDTFKQDAIVAYGLATIKNATAGVMENTLATYTAETGLCSKIIGKLETLNPVQQRQAYENVVLDIKNNGISSNQTLQTLLEKAYASVIAGGNKGGGGRGSGGGAVGGKNNSTPAQSGSAVVGAATGSGTTEDKVESFKDLPQNHWAYESVWWLKNRGIVSGTDNGSFEPDRPVTREEFAKMIVLACGINVNNQSADFSDLQNDAWYISYIGAAADAGIVNGIGDGSFGIGRNITRQDMAVMAKRALDAEAISLAKVREYTAFEDEGAFAEYAADAIKALFEAGVINGKGNNLFDSAGTATRAEAAKIIYEAFKGVEI